LWYNIFVELRENLNQRIYYGAIMNIRCNRGMALSVVVGIVGWTFAVGMVYVLTVIAFSM